ncbi:MAG: M20/M25/M40 family metallo-hydrolase [Gemmatimonadaceae bacterium]
MRRVALLLALAMPVALCAQQGRPLPAPAADWDVAAHAWDAGDYPSALEAMKRLLTGSVAAEYQERIALLTGEKWRTIEVAKDARAPRWSSDGKLVMWENATARLNGRTTTVARPGATTEVRATISGRGAVFSPDAARVLYLAGGGADGRGATVRELTIAGSADRAVPTPNLDPVQVAYDTDGHTVYVVAATKGEDPTVVYRVTDGGSPAVIAGAEGSVTNLQVVPGGGLLVYTVAARSPLARGFAGAATTRPRFGVLPLDTKAPLLFDGGAPVISADGSMLTYVRTTATAQVREGRDRTHFFLATLALRPIGEPVDIRETLDSLAAPSPTRDGSLIAFQQMADHDWEIVTTTRDGTHEHRVTREIQHDVLPRWVDGTHILGLIGEPRHRRAQLYDLATDTRRRTFHNNSIRTIAPEYEWALSPDGTRLLTVAERDGDTVTPHRHLYLTDFTALVPVQSLIARVDSNLAAERDLRARGDAAFAPIARDVRAATGEVRTGRIFEYEKALFDFDSKHITRPGNEQARNYLLARYRAFGYDARFMPFAPLVGRGRDTTRVPTANVIATLKGTVSPEVVYVVGSHFDSRAEGPGADDNTSGTAALLEAARVLARRPQAATIVFVSFTGEESGLLGSREFVREVKDSLKIAGVLNNDMFGWANDHRLDNTIRYSNPGIRDVQHAAAIEFSAMITYDAFYYKSTDAASFHEAFGDIVGGLGSYPVLGNPHYHQPHDLLEYENHQLIAEASKTTVASLMLLASSPSRLAKLAAEPVAAGRTTLTWAASPEKDVKRYVVRYGPAGAPAKLAATSTKPSVALRGVQPGWHVAVKAVNARGLEGWDAARLTLVAAPAP